MLLCTGCTPPQEPTTEQAAPSSVPIGVALAVPPGERTAIIGYVLDDARGTRLVGGLSVSAGPPQPVGSQEILLDTAALAGIEQVLQISGATRYTAVIAGGTLEALSDGSGRYHLQSPALSAIAPEETTIARLREEQVHAAYRFVRIRGVLLISADSATLADRVGPGGVPAPDTLQLKLHGPVQDTALIAQLRQLPESSVRFGDVLIEGIWQQGALQPMLIRLVR